MVLCFSKLEMNSHGKEYHHLKRLRKDVQDIRCIINEKFETVNKELSTIESKLEVQGLQTFNEPIPSGVFHDIKPTVSIAKQVNENGREILRISSTLELLLESIKSILNELIVTDSTNRNGLEHIFSTKIDIVLSRIDTLIQRFDRLESRITEVRTSCLETVETNKINILSRDKIPPLVVMEEENTNETKLGFLGSIKYFLDYDDEYDLEKMV